MLIKVKLQCPGNDPCSPYPCGPTYIMAIPLGVPVFRWKSGFFSKPDMITGFGPPYTHDDECSSTQNCAAGRCVPQSTGKYLLLK